MPALTAARNTPTRDGKDFTRGVATGVTIYQGALVCLTAAGFATPGAVSTTLKADGRAKVTVANPGANGAVTVEVEKGIFRFGNSASGDLITIADIGANAFIVDDQTVAKTNGTSTRSIAGVIVDVDAQGVWVRIS